MVAMVYNGDRVDSNPRRLIPELKCGALFSECVPPDQSVICLLFSQARVSNTALRVLQPARIAVRSIGVLLNESEWLCAH